MRSMNVRLKTAVALADMPESAAAGAALFDLLSQPENIEDQWIREAGALAGAVHSRGFLGRADQAGMLDRQQDRRMSKRLTLEQIVALIVADQPEVVGELGGRGSGSRNRRTARRN
jgi:hypothetical protein